MKKSIEKRSIYNVNHYILRLRFRQPQKITSPGAHFSLVKWRALRRKKAHIRLANQINDIYFFLLRYLYLYIYYLFFLTLLKSLRYSLQSGIGWPKVPTVTPHTHPRASYGRDSWRPRRHSFGKKEKKNVTRSTLHVLSTKPRSMHRKNRL